MKPRCRCLSLIFFCCVSFVRHSNGARILGIFPLDSPSDFSMYEETLRGLTERGHRVDVASHFPLKKPPANYTNVVNLSGKTKPIIENVSFETLESSAIFRTEFQAKTLGNKICNLLAIPEFQSLITNPPNDPPYDIVITELLYANCFIAFGRHLKIPVVSISASPMPHYMNEAVGNPLNPAFVPEHKAGSIFSMNFWQRARNTIFTWWTTYRVKSITEKQSNIVKKYFGDEMPGVRELERDLALVLVNSHPSLNGVRPNTPAVVEVGGLHIRDDKIELPAELKQWLDDSKDGLIHVSFGSLLKIESFPKDTLAELYKAFDQIAPIRVLVKTENPNGLPPGLPENVLAVKWLPQLQILRNGNMRGFVTHGGLIEIQDAVTSRVPFIAVPVFEDHIRHVKNCVDRGVALSLEHKDLTAEKFVEAVNAIVQDPKYKTNMVALSRQFLDRPKHPRDTAVFWIEYILRHGADSLRSPAVYLSWWQLALLDVYGGAIFAALLTVYLSKRFVSILILRLRPVETTLPTTKKMV